MAAAVSLQEITGLQGETIEMQEIFSFRQEGIDANGTVLGRFMPTGVRPRFVERLSIRGITLPPSLFEEHADDQLTRIRAA